MHSNPSYQNDFVSVSESPDNNNTVVTVGTGQGAVCLVQNNGRILMVHHPRYAANIMAWELPRAGSYEDEGTLDTAVRCVQEDTGVNPVPESAVSLGAMTPDAEILSNEVQLYTMSATSGKIFVSSDKARWVDTNEIIHSCLDGTIQDSFTCTAVLRAQFKGLLTR